MVYETHVPFTVALMESFAELNRTPSDWMQLFSACLSGGDCLLWRGDMQKNCKTLPNKGAGEELSKSFKDLQNLILSLLTTCYSWEVAFLGMWTQLCLS